MASVFALRCARASSRPARVALRTFARASAPARHASLAARPAGGLLGRRAAGGSHVARMSTDAALRNQIIAEAKFEQVGRRNPPAAARAHPAPGRPVLTACARDKPCRPLAGPLFWDAGPYPSLSAATALCRALAPLARRCANSGGSAWGGGGSETRPPARRWRAPPKACPLGPEACPLPPPASSLLPVA